MNRVKALVRLSAVRTRLRDAAAAAATVASQREHAAERARDQRADDIVQLDDSLPQQLQVPRPELALELFHSDRDAATASLITATTDWQGRQNDAEVARKALNSRERDLQVADKLLTEARTERNERITKYEQSTADDLSSGRARRKQR